MPPVPVDLKELAPPERIQVRGEVLTCWKTVSVEKDGNYPDPAFETCANLVGRRSFLSLRRGWPCPSEIVSHVGPMSASNTSQEARARSSAC